MGTFYVVATPIGNLEDITLRAVRILGKVSLVLAEDTRVTKKLFDKYDISTKIERCDARVEGEKIEEVIDIIKEGDDIALVSDAGTPGISDPGARLVRAVRDAGFVVVSVPGPSSVTSALSIAGVPSDSFVFLGYPPHKKGRKTFFENLTEEKKTIVFFESPHRIMKTLFSLEENVPERHIIIARELTKVHEEVLEGTSRELMNMLENDPQKQKGEFVVIISHV